MRGGGINATSSRQRRDDRSGKIDEEWEYLMALRENDGTERNMVANDIIGALGMENETIESRIDEGAV